MKTIIVDYGMGNLRSIKKKLEIINIKARISSDKNEINTADRLILPGVGHFAKGIANLKKRDLAIVLRYHVIKRKKPILGICLGMQLFSEFSEEGNTKGLGWLHSKVVKFNFEGKLNLRVPHVGWNSIHILKKSILLANIGKGSTFYFTHSYFMTCSNSKDIVATTNYGKEFTSIVENKNIFGVQFHPEKSRLLGLQLIKNFLDFS